MERKDYNKKLKFEGGYLNGERNGKGKEFYDNGNHVFEVEYLNGKIIGEIKEFKNGELVYIGECSDEEKKKYINNIYFSEFITLKRNGKGKEYYLNKENIKIKQEKDKAKNEVKEIKFYENGNLKYEGEYKDSLK